MLFCLLLPMRVAQGQATVPQFYVVCSSAANQPTVYFSGILQGPATAVQPFRAAFLEFLSKNFSYQSVVACAPTNSAANAQTFMTNQANALRSAKKNVVLTEWTEPAPAPPHQRQALHRHPVLKPPPRADRQVRRQRVRIPAEAPLGRLHWTSSTAYLGRGRAEGRAHRDRPRPAVLQPRRRHKGPARANPRQPVQGVAPTPVAGISVRPRRWQVIWQIFSGIRTPARQVVEAGPGPSREIRWRTMHRVSEAPWGADGACDGLNAEHPGQLNSS